MLTVKFSNFCNICTKSLCETRPPPSPIRRHPRKYPKSQMLHRGTLGADGCGIVNLLPFFLYPFLAKDNRCTDYSRCCLSELPPMSLYNGFPPGTRPASKRIASAGCLSGAARSHSPPRLAPVPLGPRRAGLLRLAAEETRGGRGVKPHVRVSR